jgi:vacuolar protein sorting-associated protein 41
MLQEVENMRESPNLDMTDGLVEEAEGHVLNTLLAWGTTRSLKEHVKLYEYQANRDSSYSINVRRTIESLRYRYEQSATGYLDLASTGQTEPISSESQLINTSNSVDVSDSLYNIEEIFANIAKRISIIDFKTSDGKHVMRMKLSTKESDSRVSIDAIARLYMMNNSYDEALKCFLILGAVDSTKSLEEIEEDALKLVNYNDQNSDENSGVYSFVVNIIENYHLHQYLLEANFLPEGTNCSPICALIRLVGLELAGEFLIQNCTAPQQTQSIKTGGERRGTLPLDLVADQLSGTPKLFHWYLHIVSIQKPELYVNFPTTANPPPVITTLHKKHLDLYIRYAGPNRDSTRVLAGVEAYLVAEKSTPLLSFLKVVLQLGTIGPIEVGKLLEIERRGGAGVSNIFALELAYIMENYGNKNEADALLILELYLKGAESLMLAVSFAQRTKSHSKKLWEKLIEYCLLKSTSEKSSDGGCSGILFGSLLEAAALSGADLSHLVAQIPKGMQVEGLRPRLIAAVADYRLKVLLHSKSNEIAAIEKGMLFLESSRRSSRGMRYDFTADLNQTSLDDISSDDNNIVLNDEINRESPSVLSARLRPRNRLNRYSHSMSIPIR